MRERPNKRHIGNIAVARQRKGGFFNAKIVAVMGARGSRNGHKLKNSAYQHICKSLFCQEIRIFALIFKKKCKIFEKGIEICHAIRYNIIDRSDACNRRTSYGNAELTEGWRASPLRITELRHSIPTCLPAGLNYRLGSLRGSTTCSPTHMRTLDERLFCICPAHAVNSA